MAIREILVYPDARLRQVGAAVTDFGTELVALVSDMKDTMYAASGIGLAAVQINVPKRVVVMDLSEERDRLQVFVNPEITVLDTVLADSEEGCLSVPGFRSNVKRAKKVRIDACDVGGKPFRVEAEGLLSVCIQHEVDHLNGRVFVDYLSRLRQSRIREKLKKEARQFAAMAR